MTKNQKRFLKTLHKYGSMNSEQCCKKLKLKLEYESNTYYSQLCSFLPYPNESDEFDSKINLMMYSIVQDPLNEKAIFKLSQSGENYLREKNKQKKGNIYNAWQLIIGILALIIAGIGLLGMSR